jgi:hypothetical protein
VKDGKLRFKDDLILSIAIKGSHQKGIKGGKTPEKV